MKIFLVACIIWLSCCQQVSALDCEEVSTITASSGSNTEASETCDSATTCTRPVYQDSNGGYVTTDTTWGCASSTCTTTSSCITCDTDDCNTEDLYTCAGYSYSSTDTKWESSDSVTCDPFTVGTTSSTASTKCIVVTPDAASTILDSTYETCGVNSVNSDCSSTGTQCRTCDGENCNAMANFMYCVKGTATTEDDYDDLPYHFCESKESTCTKPLILDDALVNSTFEDWGCDVECTNKSECMTCDTAGCNTWPSDGDDYNVTCYIWTWDNMWKYSESAIPCTTKIDGSLPTKCSLPKDRSSEDGYSGNGCGDCSDADSDGCLSVGDAENSGITSTLSGLFFAIALLKALMA